MTGQAWELVLGLVLVALLAGVAVAKRYLTVAGAVVGAIIGLGILVAGGLGWLVLLASFTLLGSALTRVGSGVKGTPSLSGADRGARNVLANGLPPLAFAVAYSLVPGRPWPLAFAAAVAAATSDTVSTEIGMLSRSRPRRITRPWESVRPGTSGGVSALGTMAGLLAAAAIAAIAWALGLLGSPSQFALATLLGFLGNVVDSLLGDLAELRYLCGGELLDDPSGCQGNASATGSPLVNNHVVNAVAISLAGALALLF